MNKFRAGDLKVVVEEQMSSDGTAELNVSVFATPQLATHAGLKNRLHVAGWILDATPRGRNLAERLRRCIEAGNLFKGYTVMTDVYGQKYISAGTNGFFHKRHMNTSLQALGF